MGSRFICRWQSLAVLTDYLGEPRVSDMEVQFSANTEAQLKQFVASEGKDAAQLVEETMARVLKRRAHHRR